MGLLTRLSVLLFVAAALAASTATPIVFNPIADFSVNEDANNTVINLRQVFHDAETPEADLIYSIRINSNTNLVSATVDNTTDTLTLGYRTNQFGAASITVRATDSVGLYAEDTFIVTVNAVNDGDPGDVDIDFNPSATGMSLPLVYHTPTQPDGKLVIGGNFTALADATRNRIARLNADDTLDFSFNPNVNSNVYSSAVLADGKIVIAGQFSTVGGISRNRIARLNADGTLDLGFNPDANELVYTTAVQSDGKIVIGGKFTNMGGILRNRIARLNPDGTVDAGFNPSANDSVFGMSVQPDGKIIVVGIFTNVGGMTRNLLARLNSDGTLDTNFNARANNYVYTTAVQADGKILIGGGLTIVNGTSRNYLARLNSDGTLDTAFNPNLDGTVATTAMQVDGKIILSTFTILDGVARPRILRLHRDGSLDTSFNQNVDGPVHSVTVMADGKVVIGGSFTAVGRVVRNRIARLANDPATQSLTVPTANRIEWLRGGASPEAQVVAFELSADGGTTWTGLGTGTRIAGGWEKTGLSLPASGLVRARARAASGRYNGSSGLVETRVAFPIPPNTAPTVANETADFVVNEDAPPTVIKFTKMFLDGETPPASLTYSVQANTNTPLVTAAITTLTNLTLTYAANQYGTSEITVRATDPDGLFAEDIFVVTVNSINDAPRVMLATNLVMLGDAERRVIGGFANFSPGPADESGQRLLSYTVSNDNGDLFSDPPAINEVGTLTFTPAVSAIGRATVTVIAQDDGGTANGGLDKTTNVFTISSLALIDTPGDVDPSFNPDVDERVYTATLQPDGKTIIGGEYFTTIGGTARNRLARLNADGGIDPAFNPNVGGFGLYATAVQGDGRIIIGGVFNGVGGVPRRYLARLNADGTLDTAFNPDANDAPNSIAVQADGKVIVAGGFTSVSGTTRNRLARFNADGSLEASFNPNVDYSVYGAALQPDGKIVITGLFATVNGSARDSVARLNADGTLDTGFNPNVRSWARVAAVQPDGKIVIGGDFSFVGNLPRRYCVRLNPDGTLDSGFNPNVNFVVWSIALQTDGKILIAGWFDTVGGARHNCIARLNPDGTPDAGFDPQAGGLVADVYNVTVQADGRIIIGGRFTTVDGLTRSHVARLINDPATQNLTVPGTGRVEWMRGGTSPEAQSVTFEVSTDGGTTWRPLGNGTRIAGGWALSGLNLPSSGLVRARARVTSGRCAGSSGLVETAAEFSLPNAAPIVVNPIADFAVNEDAANIVIRLTSVFNDAETAPANLVYSVQANNNAALVTATITANTNLALVYAPNQFGTSAVTVRATDAGGQFVEENFVVTVNAVNDAPVVTLPSNIIALDSSARSLASIASFSPGPANESSQRLVGYVVSNDNPPLFSVQPAIDNAGTLTFTPTANGNGSATVTVIAEDDGGTANSGIDKATNALTITVRSVPAVPGTVDADFKPDVNNYVSSVATQVDGKLVIGGYFSAVGGVACANIARLNADGTLDLGFSPTTDNAVNCAMVQPDGKIVIGGQFTNVAGAPRNRVARLYSNGALDTDFTPTVGSNWLFSLAPQLDGKIIIGGGFPTVNGTTRSNIARLNADGTLDPSFSPNANGLVRSTLVQADGRIVIGGNFTTVGDTARTNLARLNADGTVDPGFNAGANGTVLCITVQADGRIVIGGNFTSVDGMARTSLARLNADGTVDPNFNPNVTSSIFPVAGVNSAAVQTDGKIVFGGEFSTVNGTTRRRIARLYANGTLDPSFNPDSLATVFGTLLQADGKVIIAGGSGSTVNGETRQPLGRLLNDLSTQSLTVVSISRVEWLRGGASPEALDVAFELSINGGSTWTPLGSGTRITGGWELTGLSLPASGQLRARARVTGGQYNGSSGLVETKIAFSGLMPISRLTGVALLGNGSFQFGFTNLSGVPFTALGTTNLSLPASNWTVLGQATEILPGQFQFTDRAATNFPYRFYQIRSP